MDVSWGFAGRENREEANRNFRFGRKARTARRHVKVGYWSSKVEVTRRARYGSLREPDSSAARKSTRARCADHRGKRWAGRVAQVFYWWVGKKKKSRATRRS